MKPFEQYIPGLSWNLPRRRVAGLALVAILVLGGVLRFAYFFESGKDALFSFTTQNKVFDQYAFVDLARDILSHNWLGSKFITQSPVYAYGIAVLFRVFGEHIRLIFVMQIFFGLCAIWLFYRTARLLFENRLVGLVAAFMAAVYSSFVFYEGAILRAAVISYVNLAAFYFFLRAVRKGRANYSFLAGLFLGLSMILRPNILFFMVPGMFFFSDGSRRTRLKQAVLVLLGICLMITPLALRNRALGGNVLISTSHPHTFWASNTPYAAGFGQTPLKQYSLDKANNILHSDGSIVVHIIKGLYEDIRKEPGRYFSLYCRKVKMALNGYEVPSNLSYDLTRDNYFWLRAAFLDFRIVSPLAILGLLLSFAKFRHNRILYSFLFLLLGVVILFHVQARLRLVMVPFFILPAAYTISWFLDMLRRKNFLVLSSAVGVFIIISFYTRPDDVLIERYFGSRVRRQDNMNFVRASLHYLYENKDQLSAAERNKLLMDSLRCCKKAIELAPDSMKCRYYIRLGTIYVKLKQGPEAEQGLFSGFII